MADKTKDRTAAETLKEKIHAQMLEWHEARQKLNINMGEAGTKGTPPELDPHSSEFDIDKYAKANGGYAALQRQIDSTRRGMIEDNKRRHNVDLTEDDLSELLVIQWIETLKGLFTFMDEHPEIVEQAEYRERLHKAIEKEIQKPEYGGISFKDLLNTGYDDTGENIIPGSLLDKAEAEAKRGLERADALTMGRNLAAAQKRSAVELGAVMELSGGNYPLFSARDLWAAFAPGMICEMGTLDRNLIDPAGMVRKMDFAPGEIKELDTLDDSLKALMLLSAIIANTTENYYEQFVKDGEIRFSVSGILKSITSDPRYMLTPEQLDNSQLTIDRKTAGVLYLEGLLKPLQNYIGKLPNGSRYSVFNYIGYDITTDTMAIRTPYISQLWILTQSRYRERQAALIEARTAGRKPKPDDKRPLEINKLFKDRAINADPVTLEIAIYITNVLVSAGTEKQGGYKENRTTFKTVVDNCPTLRQRIAEFESARGSNPTAMINNELRKFKMAYKLIMDSSKCDATKEFEFIDVQPVKNNGQTDPAKWEFIPPTKSRLKDEIYIKWRHKKTAEAIGGKN